MFERIYHDPKKGSPPKRKAYRYPRPEAARLRKHRASTHEEIMRFFGKKPRG